MANSYTKVMIHGVWSTKNRQMYIEEYWESQLWTYIAGIAKKRGIHPIKIGGFDNHIHALVHPPKGMNLPTLFQILKAHSSKWINENEFIQGKFYWQDGYGAFSVSPSQLPAVEAYIQNQRIHHQGETFEDEFRGLLKKHSIDYEERYLFG